MCFMRISARVPNIFRLMASFFPCRWWVISCSGRKFHESGLSAVAIPYSGLLGWYYRVVKETRVLLGLQNGTGRVWEVKREGGVKTPWTIVRNYENRWWVIADTLTSFERSPHLFLSFISHIRTVSLGYPICATSPIFPCAIRTTWKISQVRQKSDVGIHSCPEMKNESILVQILIRTGVVADVRYEDRT